MDLVRSAGHKGRHVVLWKIASPPGDSPWLPSTELPSPFAAHSSTLLEIIQIRGIEAYYKALPLLRLLCLNVREEVWVH
jgi:hypothetical protein